MGDVLILGQILSRAEAIFGRITSSQLARYDSLQTSLCQTDVSRDADYQRIFNGFYRMQRRSAGWYQMFFALLEREKRNETVRFGHILGEVHERTGRIEPSFCSKLVATIRPRMPVYDRYVRESLMLRLPSTRMPDPERLAAFRALYAELTDRCEDLVQTKSFLNLRTAFDGRFPTSVHFTDVKQLDLMLWQNRLVQ